MRKPYIIAEIGVNHNGNQDTAISLIDVAKRSGADAVKFQLYDEYELYPDWFSKRQMLQRCDLEDASMLRCRTHSAYCGLDFIVSVFSMSSMPFVDRLNPDWLKVASPDCVNTDLIEELRRFGVPLIVSVGGLSTEEYAKVDDYLVGGDMLMHCISEYPLDPSTANLSMIRVLQDDFSVPVGFSDHTISVHFGAMAVCAGAEILEKHITMDRGDLGPDHHMSLEPSQFYEYVKGARRAYQSMYSHRPDLYPHGLPCGRQGVDGNGIGRYRFGAPV